MPSAETAEVRVEGLADTDWLERVHDGCDRLWTQGPQVPDPDRFRFESAVIELATNVIRHSRPHGPGPVRTELVLHSQPSQLSAALSDDGAPVRVDLDPEPVDDLAESGRGIRLVLRAVDSLSLAREQGRNVWRIARAW